MGYGFDMWGSSFIAMILLWVIIIGVALWVLRLVFNPTTQTHPQESDEQHQRSPLDVAKERYARGELSRDEFQTICDDLDHIQGGVK